MAKILIISPEDAGGATRSSLLDAIEELKQRGKRVAGIVAPTVDDRRHLIRISCAERRLLQLNEIAEDTKEKMRIFKQDMKGEMEFHADQEGVPLKQGDSTVAIGPFIFDEKVFLWARCELDENSKVDYLVVDEAIRNLNCSDFSQRMVVVARKNIWSLLSEKYTVEFTSLREILLG